ncbi:DUF6898 family protein [Gimibacter soli]|uniref:DUF6898 domain-containing protein n=1 Tax=Gimibacter soli TaxID=3024400 RepID=A0AAE9XS48_9PROT|nr:hypothetical protein [Gimibacter soli]WCL53000.1 hypothetical protein PH603_10665 [Gimibacter soli]
MAGAGVIIEFIKVGTVVKVTAVCERTGLEVSLVGDPRASRAELERLAVRKLEYVRAKKAAEGGGGPGGGRGGILT